MCGVDRNWSPKKEITKKILVESTFFSTMARNMQYPFVSPEFIVTQGRRFAIDDYLGKRPWRFDTMTRRTISDRDQVSSNSSTFGSASHDVRQHQLFTDSQSRLTCDMFLATVCPPTLLISRKKSGYPISRCEVLSSPRLPTRPVITVSRKRLREETNKHSLQAQ
jgi:hypothetical protein